MTKRRKQYKRWKREESKRYQKGEKINERRTKTKKGTKRRERREEGTTKRTIHKRKERIYIERRETKIT